MKYETVAEAYRDLEQAGGRLALIDRLAALLARTPAELLPTVCYLCQGLIAPQFAVVDLGLAEKLAVRAVATATGAGPEQVAASVRETGDLGQAAIVAPDYWGNCTSSFRATHDISQQALTVTKEPAAS